MNAKFPEEVRPLAEERKKKCEQATAKEDAAEGALVADIKMIEEYLPRLISLEDIPVNPEETDIIRRQFDEVFTQEEQTYLASAEEEQSRKERLGRGLEVYRHRMLDDYVATELMWCSVVSASCSFPFFLCGSGAELFTQRDPRGKDVKQGQCSQTPIFSLGGLQTYSFL
ncbi:hypothetical protein C4B63_105g57 [Trypanosoma cruzi]|uniref:Uncharacterized protein n=1 Tax=Trypanosoma cruzi TaxID=5693 RepID=A0A2V2URY3_TRYCR|nr:hypothetical protein C4B63_105g57 [Trypanosoma cruzi]